MVLEQARVKKEIVLYGSFAKAAGLKPNERSTVSGGGCDGNAGGTRQIEKLVPQPQDALAWGLLMRNEAPIRSSTKSISEPAR